MSELPPPDPGTPSGSNNGGHRTVSLKTSLSKPCLNRTSLEVACHQACHCTKKFQAGQRTAKAQARRDAAMKATKEAWGVSDYMNIFPTNIRPDTELGDSAVHNLRSISNKVQQLPTARLLMRNECVDTNGHPVKLSFKHTTNILNHLKEQEVSLEISSLSYIITNLD
jgi:hypothetical protein